MKELMDKLKMKAASMGVGKFLSRLKIPFIVISVILIALECVVRFGIIRGTSLPPSHPADLFCFVARSVPSASLPWQL
jgi:hypothetical protein